MENQYSNHDELTLRELLLAIRDYGRFFLRRWYWFLLGGLIGGGIGFFVAYREPNSFSAPLTFVMNVEQDAKLGAGAILGSLGIGGKESGSNNALKLLEMAESRQLLGDVLFDSAVVNTKSQLIADHLIEQYDYDERWEESPSMRGFRFAGQKPGVDDILGNGVFKSLHQLLVKENEGLFSISVKEGSGVFTILTSTKQPELSIAITEGIYRTLTSYYVNSTMSGKQQTLERLRSRADSVEIALNVAEARLARFEDRRGRVLSSSELEGQRLNREVMILSTMYAEIVKNRETTAFLLNNETPAFSLIDRPLQPLYSTRQGWTPSLAVGIVLGLLLAGVVLFFRKLIRDSLGGEGS